MEKYFTNIDKNSRTWTNIHAILCHEKEAYINQQIEHEQLEDADHKIQELEKKIEIMETDMESSKEQKTKLNLDSLIIEVEDELSRVIGELIWFIKPEPKDTSYKVLYNPDVGPVDYNNFFGKYAITTCFINLTSLFRNSRLI